jgi:hypothetical protein
MRLPGFTAVTALDRTGTSNWEEVNPVRAGGAVRPAFISSCYARCMASAGNDPFADYNCHCLCSGHAFKTCWPI